MTIQTRNELTDFMPAYVKSAQQPLPEYHETCLLPPLAFVHVLALLYIPIQIFYKVLVLRMS